LLSLEKFTTEDPTCISLYVPVNKPTIDIIAQLRHEIGHISNAKEPLKSRAIETLSRTISFIQRYTHNKPFNGFALFCAPDYPIHFIEPRYPLKVNVYRSDTKFFLDPLV